MHFAVKATRTQQCGVKHILTVGGSEHYYARFAIKTVHLGEQLIQGLVVFATEAHIASCTANSINLIDEHHAGCFLLSLAEEFADTRCALSHKHLDKVATGA